MRAGLCLRAAAVCCLLGSAACAGPAAAHHSDAALERIAERESGRDRWAVNYGDQPDGSPSWGYYQFGQQTWDWLMSELGPHYQALRGVPPWGPMPMDVQLLAARRLWDGGNGARHWLGCARSLGLL